MPDGRGTGRALYLSRPFASTPLLLLLLPYPLLCDNFFFTETHTHTHEPYKDKDKDKSDIPTHFVGPTLEPMKSEIGLPCPGGRLGG